MVGHSRFYSGYAFFLFGIKKDGKVWLIETKGGESNEQDKFYTNFAKIPKEKTVIIDVAIITPIIEETIAFFLSI